MWTPREEGFHQHHHHPRKVTSSLEGATLARRMAVGDMDSCPHHDKNKVVLFCQTCEELICTKCISHGPQCMARHQDHVFLDLLEAYDIQKEDVQKLVAKLRESLEGKRKFRQEALNRIQKLKFALLRKKEYVSRQCRALCDQIKTEKIRYTQRLEHAIASSLEREENAHKELDYDTVSREGLIGSTDSILKISTFRCTTFLKNITRVKKEIKEQLTKDDVITLPGSGDEWMNQINSLREITLRLHGEKKALGRAFMLEAKAPSQPRVIMSWCVIGSDSVSISWKQPRNEKIQYFRLTCSASDPHSYRPLLTERTIKVQPAHSKRNTAIFRRLEPNCEFTLRLYAVNNYGDSPPAEIYFRTQSQPSFNYQGRVWSKSRPYCENFSFKKAFQTWFCLAAGGLFLFALFWIAFATYEREWCDVVVDKVDKTVYDDVCPLPVEQMMNIPEINSQKDGESNQDWWSRWIYGS